MPVRAALRAGAAVAQAMTGRPAAAVGARGVLHRRFAATTDRPTVTERVREAAEISKEHIKGAAKNQAQGVEDVATGRASAREVAREHGAAAAADVHQWGEELHAAARGDALPGEARVRDLPPMEGGTVEDRVRRTPTRAGAETGGGAPPPPGDTSNTPTAP